MMPPSGVGVARAEGARAARRVRSGRVGVMNFIVGDRIVDYVALISDEVARSIIACLDGMMIRGRDMSPPTKTYTR